MKLTKIFYIFCLIILALKLPIFAQSDSLAGSYLIEIGKTYFNKGQYQEARQEFEKCLLTDQGNKTAKQYLSKIAEKIGQSPEGTKKLVKNTFRITSKKQAAIEHAFESAQNKGAPSQESENSYLERKLKEKPKTGVEDNLTAAEEEKSEKEKKFETWVGGAWSLPRNLLYLETFTQFYWHNQQFNNNRKKTYWAGGGKDIERNIETKINYGITDNLTYMVNIPYKSLLWKSEWQRNRTKGFADIWTGIKYKLTDDPISLTPQIRVKIPTNYNPDKIPSLGRDQWDYEFMLLTAKNFKPLPFYAKFDTGYRIRSGDRSTNEIPYFFEAGFIPINWLLLKTTFDGVNGIGGTGDTQEDYTKYTVGVLFNFFRQFKFEVGYGNIFSGKNTSASNEWYFKTITLF